MASNKATGGIRGLAKSKGFSLRVNPNYGKGGSTSQYKYNIRGKKSNMWAKTTKDAKFLMRGEKKARG